MTTNFTVTRRAVLAAGAAATGAAALAACSGSSGAGASGAGAAGSRAAGDTAAGDTAGAAAGSAPPAGSPPADNSAGGASSSGGSSSAGGSSHHALVALAQVPVGTSAAVRLADGSPAIVTRTGAGTAVCFSAICTHQGCTVKPAGTRFDCPCHGSRYDARTGAVLAGPAPAPLPAVRVTVQDGTVTQDG